MTTQNSGPADLLVTLDEQLLADFLAEVTVSWEQGLPSSTPPVWNDRPELQGSVDLLARVVALLYRSAVIVCEDAPDADADLLEGTIPRSASPRPDPFPGEYRLIDRVAGGGCGEVWLAEHVSLPWKVAVKTIHPEGSSGDRAIQAEALRRDVEALIALRHPNIVRVLAWKHAGADDYLVMEYVAGGSFRERLRQEPGRRFDWATATRYVCDVGEGLLEAHRRGIIHRDIKPGNILWDQEHDEAMLTDFGISAWMKDLPRSGGGTPLYMAPEVFDGVNSPAQDVYSLAATLYELITGHPPFLGTIAELPALARTGLPVPDLRCAEMPEPIEQMIRAGLSADLRARPALEPFIQRLRGSLNGTLAASLAALAAPASGTVPVRLRVAVRDEVSGQYAEVSTTPTHVAPRTRDMKKVPPPAPVAKLRTGNQIRIEVTATRAGFLTVFNLGPTGNLNLLYPDELTDATVGKPVAAGEIVSVDGITMTPPAGRERVTGIWSEKPFPLTPAALRSITDPGLTNAARPGVATRDMTRVRDALTQLPTGGWHAVVLELDHAAVEDQP